MSSLRPGPFRICPEKWYPKNSLTFQEIRLNHWGSDPSLVQIIACRQFGTKPLFKPRLAYCQLDPWEPISVKFWQDSIDGLVQDCSNSIANALELLQSCAKPSYTVLKMHLRCLQTGGLSVSASVLMQINSSPLDKMVAIWQTIFSDAFSWIKFCILIKISLKFVPTRWIDNITALV